MKTPIRIQPVIAETIGLCYQSMQSAIEYARSIANDPEVPAQVRNDFMSIAASVRFPLERIERRIPKSTYERFLHQVRDDDALRMDNIRQMYLRMMPEQREMLETVAEAILKNEFELEKL